MTVVSPACVARPIDRMTTTRTVRRVEAFQVPYRAAIADLMHGAPALEDLADTYPALLFALATGYGTPSQRERARRLVVAGASLREAANAIGVAWWLRKLPAQSLAAPLPAFPAEGDFGQRIGALVPPDPRIASFWLARIGYAIETCSPRYALWLARQADLVATADELFVLMAAWAWFSENEGHLGHRLLRKRWHPDMSFRRAREELTLWRQRLRLVECLGFGIETPWLNDGTAGGYDFVALRTADDFVAESEALDNCLDQYADQLRTGASAVFSIRKAGRSIACVEIGLHETEITMPTIVQLRTARNRRAPPDIWQAAFAWLGGQRLEPLIPDRHKPSARKRMDARRKLWAPYLAFLSGTGHETSFRRTVLAPMAARTPPIGMRRILTRRHTELAAEPTGDATGRLPPMMRARA